MKLHLYYPIEETSLAVIVFSHSFNWFIEISDNASGDSVTLTTPESFWIKEQLSVNTTYGFKQWENVRISIKEIRGTQDMIIKRRTDSEKTSVKIRKNQLFLTAMSSSIIYIGYELSSG
jgi:hypothetical protein